MLAILGLKNKGGFQNLQDSGGPFGLWRVKFFRGGLDFEKGKALFWHWIIPIFNYFLPAADHFTLI